MLQDAQWKARLTAMEEFMEKVQGMEDVSPEVASFLVQGIAVLPGWSEKNFQVSSRSAADDLTSSCIIFCNLAARCHSPAVLIHSQRDCLPSS